MKKEITRISLLMLVVCLAAVTLAACGGAVTNANGAKVATVIFAQGKNTSRIYDINVQVEKFSDLLLTSSNFDINSGATVQIGDTLYVYWGSNLPEGYGNKLNATGAKILEGGRMNDGWARLVVTGNVKIEIVEVEVTYLSVRKSGGSKGGEVSMRDEQNRRVHMGTQIERGKPFKFTTFMKDDWRYIEKVTVAYGMDKPVVLKTDRNGWYTINSKYEHAEIVVERNDKSEIYFDALYIDSQDWAYNLELEMSANGKYFKNLGVHGSQYVNLGDKITFTVKLAESLSDTHEIGYVVYATDKNEVRSSFERITPNKGGVYTLPKLADKEDGYVRVYLAEKAKRKINFSIPGDASINVWNEITEDGISNGSSTYIGHKIGINAWSTVSNKRVKAVKVNDVVLKLADDDCYYFVLGNADVTITVELEANPEVTLTFSFTFTDINNIKMSQNNSGYNTIYSSGTATVTSDVANGTMIRLQIGAEDGKKVTKVTVGGKEIFFEQGGIYMFTAKADTTVIITTASV